MFSTTLASHVAVVFVALGIASAQSEFSAELVNLQATGTPTLAKVYFAKDKKRIEMQDASGDDSIIVRLGQPTTTKRGTHIQAGGRGDAIIMNFAASTSTVLFPQEKKYAEGSLKNLMPSELYGLYAFVHPADADNACAEWMQRPGTEGETCRNLGRETISGRSTIKYELSCYGEVCRLWIDRNLHALVKRETAWNSTELRNITEGPQPPNLFEIPPGTTARRLAVLSSQPTHSEAQRCSSRREALTDVTRRLHSLSEVLHHMRRGRMVATASHAHAQEDNSPCRETVT
jgi:hypothetical protein